MALGSSVVALAASRAQPALARLASPPPVIGDSDAWVRLDPDGTVVGRGTTALLASDGPLVLISDGAGRHALNPSPETTDLTDFTLSGGDRLWRGSGRVAFEPDLAGLIRMDLQLVYLGRTPTSMSAKLQWAIQGTPPDSWMVPGFFYGQGRPTGYRGHSYPRLEPAGGDADDLVSNQWGFRTDRAAHATVLAWTDTACLGLAAEPTFGGEPNGLEMGITSGQGWLALSFPYEEFPRSYTPTEDGWYPANYETYRVQPGQEITLTSWVYVAQPIPHAYDPLLRWMYARSRASSELRPWFDGGSAASLAATGIARWHADPDRRVLFEAVTFEQEPDQPRIFRRQEHVGWVSGVPTALALARFARVTADERLQNIALGVIERIATQAVGPAGVFWSDWVDGRGWGSGWSPVAGWIQARTSAEATLFLLRAYAEELALGRHHPQWLDATRDNLMFAMGAQNTDGNFGTYYRASDGQVVDWSGSAGLLWAAALVEGWRVTGDRAFLQAARRGGDYYAAQVAQGTLRGAPEDADLTASSEDGYNALLTYMALYRADPIDRLRWLDLARQSANWMLTFRLAYNVTFANDTLLGALGFATRGGDLASPRNNHLHVYGLICLEDLLDLWETTRDAYYLERARDALLFSWQTIARYDGDFGAGQGMMTEEWFQTHWIGTKGYMEPISHVWSLGMVLHGWYATHRFGDLVVDGRSGQVVLLAPGALSEVTARPGSGLAFEITNPLDHPLSLRARLVDIRPGSVRIGGNAAAVQNADSSVFTSLVVAAGGSERVEISADQ
jgi:hypothetical protein